MGDAAPLTRVLLLSPTPDRDRWPAVKACVRHASDAQLTTWVRACTDSLNVHDGHLIIDAAVGRSPIQLTGDFGTGTVLVLEPDVRCLVALQKAIDISGTPVESRKAWRPGLLLNQFDASDPLHCEIR